MIFQTDDLRIAALRPLIQPQVLMEELPIGEKSSATVAKGREQIQAVLHGDDDRLLVVVGPCSIHDPVAALDYARRLKASPTRPRDDLLIVMRVYFEKPRTTVGWKGLINDPHLDGTFAINEGLHMARRLLLDVAELGMPAGLRVPRPDLAAVHRRPGLAGARSARAPPRARSTANWPRASRCRSGFKNGTDGSDPDGDRRDPLGASTRTSSCP